MAVPPPRGYEPCIDENPILPTLGHSGIPDMPSITIEFDGVTKLLQRVNPSKATGPGLIPMRVLKKLHQLLRPTYALFSNNQLALGQSQLTGNMQIS